MTQPRGIAKRAGEAALGWLTVGVLRLIRMFDPVKTANFAGGLLRRIGPHLKEHEIGRANLKAAFPEKSPEEIDAILMKVWDNLGRVGSEFAHLDRLWDLQYDEQKTRFMEADPVTREHFWAMHGDGKPALIFAAHLGNWELTALAGPTLGLDTAYLFRRPNIASIDAAVQRIRAVNMGQMIPASREAPFQVIEALEQGKHVGILVDQYFGRGVDVNFFGRVTKANPMIARLARQFDCPIRGTRIVRLPGYRFRAELTEEIAPVRDASGQIDIQGTMQVITGVVEGWIREAPEQWLWLHRRWR